MPPYNGFGSEEDSLSNCLHLIPKPPKRDFIKFMQKDRQGLESNVLRFIAKLDTQGPIEKGRRFTISYFLSDDTILVFEPPQRNSGIIGGKFLERGRIKKPDGISYYSPLDLFIGNRVEFYKHAFILIDADEYAVNYMEVHADEFPHADVEQIINKVKSLHDVTELKSSLEGEATTPGEIKFENLQRILGDKISTQEALTLARYFGVQETNERDLVTLIATVQEQLRKVNYENFSLMSDACEYQDQHNTGFIPLTNLKNIAKTFKVPLKAHLLQVLLQHVDINENGEADYKQFLSFLNWRDMPVSSQTYLPNLAFGVEVNTRKGPFEYLNHVQYQKLLDSIS